MKCEICESNEAHLICPRCGQNVCSKCFNPELGLCSLCGNKQKSGNASLSTKRGLLQTFGRLFPLGIAFIFTGMILTMIASLLSAQTGGGVVIIFPFIIGQVSGTLALVIMVVFIVISLLIMFLPWILGPRRILKAVERMTAVKPEVRGGEDYLITLKMPGFKEEDVEVRVFNNDLIVEASKNEEVFRKTYELPRDFETTRIKYNFEDDFLIINVSLKRKEEA